MVRALLDANVLISAAIHPSGPSGQIVVRALLERSFEAVLSSTIVEEVETAFALRKVRKYLRDPNEAVRWLADVVVVADLVQDPLNIRAICRDPADDFVLAAAVEGRAQAIVTGDDDLLALGEHEGIAIMTPRAFIDRIAA